MPGLLGLQYISEGGDSQFIYVTSSFNIESFRVVLKTFCLQLGNHANNANANRDVSCQRWLIEFIVGPHLCCVCKPLHGLLPCAVFALLLTCERILLLKRYMPYLILCCIYLIYNLKRKKCDQCCCTYVISIVTLCIFSLCCSFTKKKSQKIAVNHSQPGVTPTGSFLFAICLQIQLTYQPVQNSKKSGKVSTDC